MNKLISRKQFFREAWVHSVRLSLELLDAFSPEENCAEKERFGSLEADLPPEILDQEACRLGVDPSDRAGVRVALGRHLNKPMSG